jgi:Raf kinase inhibitor-like YbhB/YbcL family protein
MTIAPRFAGTRRAAALLAAACLGASLASCSRTPLTLAPSGAAIRLTSPAFPDGGPIPSTFTCDGGNHSPPLAWPRETNAEGYVLAMIDLDAPGGDFVHWLLLDIPPSTNSLGMDSVPGGAKEGTNSFGQPGYGGPCPPPGAGPHRYRFVLYALDGTVPISAGATLSDLLHAVRGRVVGTGVLVGTYGRR